MSARNDVKVRYAKADPRTGNIPEGTKRQEMAAYEKLPPKAREALRNAAYDHSSHQLLKSAQIKGWSEDDMVAAVARADEKKRDALIRTGCLTIAA